MARNVQRQLEAEADRKGLTGERRKQYQVWYNEAIKHAGVSAAVNSDDALTPALIRQRRGWIYYTPSLRTSAPPLPTEANMAIRGGRRIDTVCDCCGKTFPARTDQHVNPQRHYCSRECTHKAQRLQLIERAGTPEERLLARREIDANGCWVWTGRHERAGYGHIDYDGKAVYVHRLAYETWRGPVADGLELDHLCRNRACFNPDHLEPVTRQENIRRAVEARRLRRASRCS